MKKTLVILAALPLAGCFSFGAKPPPSLLDLNASAPLPAGQTQSAATSPSITIQVPVTPQSLSTARVPVQTSPTEVAYVPKAQWIEPPARLFARLLSDTITSRTGRVVLSPAQSFADPGAQLSGELRSLGMDASTRAAVATFDAALMRGEGKAVEKRRFTASVPVNAIDGTTVGPALNQAANQVAGEVADWVGR